MSISNPVNLGVTGDATDQDNYTHSTIASVPAGALVVAAVGWDSDTTAQLPTVSGGGLTWREDKTITGTSGADNVGVSLWSALAPSGLASATTINAAMAPAATTFSALVGACYMVGATGALDGTGGQFRSAPTGSWSSLAVTNTVPDTCFIVANMHNASVSLTSTPFAFELFDAETVDAIGLALNFALPTTLPGATTMTGSWGSAPDQDAVAAVMYAGRDTPARFVNKGTVGVTADSVLNPSNLAPGLPASTQNGDLLLIVTSSRSNSATVATPTGYTAWPGSPVASGTVSGGKIYVFYRFVQGGESAPTVTWTGLTTGTTGDSAVAYVLAWRYVDLTPYDPASIATGTDAAITTTATVASSTSLFTDADRLAIAIRINDTAHTWTPPTGNAPQWLERNDTHTTTGTGHSLLIAEGLFPAAGASGSTTAAPSNTVSSRGLSITLGLAAKRPNPRQVTSLVAPQQAAV